MESIDLKPFRGGWKIFEAAGVEPYFVGMNAKNQALDYAKTRQRSNSRSIRILDSAGAVIGSIAAVSFE